MIRGARLRSNAKWSAVCGSPWRSARAGFGLSVLAAAIFGAFAPAYSRADLGTYRAAGRETGLPLPRFVSVKRAPARMRVGPSRKYRIKWIYERSGVPLEIIAEYDNWRQVRDADGATGWMHSALLSNRRTGVVAPWLRANAPLRDGPSSAAATAALLGPRVALRIYSCDGSWCDVATMQNGVSGYLAQAEIWGVYEGEHWNN